MAKLLQTCSHVEIMLIACRAGNSIKYDMDLGETLENHDTLAIFGRYHLAASYTSFNDFLLHACFIMLVVGCTYA